MKRLQALFFSELQIRDRLVFRTTHRFKDGEVVTVTDYVRKYSKSKREFAQLQTDSDLLHFPSTEARKMTEVGN